MTVNGLQVKGLSATLANTFTKSQNEHYVEALKATNVVATAALTKGTISDSIAAQLQLNGAEIKPGMAIKSTAYKIAPTADAHDVVYTVVVTLGQASKTLEVTVHYDESINEHKISTISVAASTDYLTSSGSAAGLETFVPETLDKAKFTLSGEFAKDATFVSVAYHGTLDKDSKTPVADVTLQIGASTKVIQVPLAFELSNNQYVISKVTENNVAISSELKNIKNTKDPIFANGIKVSQFQAVGTPAQVFAVSNFQTVQGSEIEFTADVTFKLGQATKVVNGAHVMLSFVITQPLVDAAKAQLKALALAKFDSEIKSGLISAADIDKFLGD